MDVKVLTDDRQFFMDGEVVWSWRAHASAKFVTMLAHRTGDGDSAWFTGESPYKP